MKKMIPAKDKIIVSIERDSSKLRQEKVEEKRLGKIAACGSEISEEIKKLTNHNVFFGEYFSQIPISTEDKYFIVMKEENIYMVEGE